MNASAAQVVHVLSQDGQPYGSERRCCNHCGVMIWGASAPLHVDNWTDWRASPSNCGRALPKAFPEDVDPADTQQAHKGR